MHSVADLDQFREQLMDRPAGERALEREVFTGSNQLPEPPQHYPAGLERRRLGAECGESLSNYVGVDEGTNLNSALQEVWSGRRLPGPVRPSDDDRLRPFAFTHERIDSTQLTSGVSLRMSGDAVTIGRAMALTLLSSASSAQGFYLPAQALLFRLFEVGLIPPDNSASISSTVGSTDRSRAGNARVNS